MLIKVCTGAACSKNFSKYTLERAESMAAKNPKIKVEACGCQGNCKKGPTVILEQGGNKTTHSYMNGVELKNVLRKKGF